MPEIARKYDFQPDTDILSGQVDEELNQLVEAVNDRAEKDGSLQANLNADELDGFDASETGGTGTIPVCNGDLQVDLNAEFLGGLSASDFADAGFPAGTALPFYQVTPPAGWTPVARPSVDSVLAWGKTAAGGALNSATWLDIVNHLAVTVNSHVLTTAEIPAHSHETTFLVGGSGPAVSSLTSQAASTNEGITSGLTGGGGGHTHTTSVGGVANPSTWRPPIAWIVVATKDA